MDTKTKRMLSGVGAAVVALALLLGGTYAYTVFEHKSNPFRNDPNYQGRLVEDYEEKEWEKDVKIKKEISVKNVGGTGQFQGSNWGDIFVRVKLKEHMDITPIDYIYYPGDDADKYTRFMVDKDGSFVRFPAAGADTAPTAAQLDTIRGSAAWNNVVADTADRAAFTSALTPANFIRLRGYYDTQDYWYVATKAGDPNGQYGAFVVMEKTADPAGRIYITPSVRAAGVDYGSGLAAPAPSDVENGECLYPVHRWDEYEPHTCDMDTHQYAEWELGTDAAGDDTWIMAADWDGLPVKKWILDPDTGWATWGDALAPGEETDLLLKSITPIKMPDGQLLYVIHADMQCTDLSEMLKDDFWLDDGGDPDEWIIRDAFDPSGKTTGVSGVSIYGGNKAMVVGDEDQLKAIVRPAGATNKGVKWRSSNPGVVTVDDDGNIEAVGPGTAVVTVTTDDGGFESEITITVTAKTIPAMGVSIKGPASIELNIGQTYTPEIEVTPANSTDTPGWSSANSGIAGVNPATGVITGVAPGTTTVTVAVGGKTANISVTVKPNVVPGTNVAVTSSKNITLEVGQTHTPTISKTPADTTDIPAWSSANSGIAGVNTTTGLITGVAPGSTVVTVTLRTGVTDTINVTVTQAADSIAIVGGDTTILVGQSKTLTITRVPASATGDPVWSRVNGTGQININAATGEITGVAAGTATVTAALGTKTAAINVTVYPATGAPLPLLAGEGPYAVQGSDTQALNYGMEAWIDMSSESAFANDSMIYQSATIKLRDIIDPSYGTNYSAVTVSSSVPAVNSKVAIGTDKDGDAAIVINYYGTLDIWQAAYLLPGRPFPALQLALTLGASGYTPVNIKVDMAFNRSFAG